MRSLIALLLLVAASSFGAGANAEENSACSAFAWPLAREFGWLSAANLPTAESGGAVALNGAALVKLRPMAEVSFAMSPERQPKVADSRGAVLNVDPGGKPGMFQITLSEEAWVDVVQNGARVKSSAFSGKQGCPGMRKSVRFELAGAPFVVQISGASGERITMAVAPAE